MNPETKLTLQRLIREAIRDLREQEEMGCPKPAVDLKLNTKNRDAAIKAKHIQYGPLNLADEAYWERLADHWNTTPEVAKESRCENCVAFDISPRMLECMPGKTSDDDGWLGYCWMHHFKCHSARSCRTWAKGGPIEEDATSYDWQKRSESVSEGRVLEEGKFANKTLSQALELLDSYGANTWIFFDTETTGFSPNKEQITEVAAIAVDPLGWAGKPRVLGQYHEKITLNPDIQRRMNDPASEERVKWEEMQARRVEKGKEYEPPQAVLKLTRYGERGRRYIDEQEALRGFVEFVESFPNPVLVAQNARFDMRFVNHRSDKKLPRVPVIDTAELMQNNLVPLVKALAQETPEGAEMKGRLEKQVGRGKRISVSLGVVAKAFDISIDEWHNAMADVKMLMEALREVVTYLRESGDAVDIEPEQRSMFAKRDKSRKQRAARRFAKRQKRLAGD